MQRLIRQATMLAFLALAATVLVTTGTVAPASAAPGDNPVGALESAGPMPGEVRLTGWAVDANSSAPLDLHVYADGNFIGYGKADEHRPDVAASYPSAGPAHGFDVTLGLGPGRHVVCAFAINTGPGDTNTQLGCMVVANDTPFGWLDAATRVAEGVHLQGWSLDPVALGSESPVYVAIGWGWSGIVAANSPKGLDAAYPGAGPGHGFDVVLPLPAREGPVPVCVYGTRAGHSLSTIACTEVDASTTPYGSLDTVRSGTDSIRVTGWALDPDAGNGPIAVEIHTEGGATYGALTLLARPDVAAAHPGFGGAHGFYIDLPAHHAGRMVCAYAVNVGPGGNRELGCQRAGTLVPAGSGTGRRIVYANLDQYVWLVGADGFADRSYLVSGRYQDPGPGVYQVYGFIRYASSVTEGITMDYFVAFHPAGVGYGFHAIPVYADGTPLQSESELGSFRSAGCVRQAMGDAIYLWNWAQIGDPVVVV
ncbi:MAG: L,D-transpeptidase family protein [Acidimicrobiia bacterium]|nr:L,D-transpeptidase family protein [Acidimicrobiia bacterium]